MIVAKQIADLLTGLRVALAFSLPIIGVMYGADALILAIWILLFSWITDALDGPLARRSSRQYHTWIGDNDLGVDMTVSFGLLIYMLLSGYLTLASGLIYISVWGLYFLRFGVPRSLGMLVQAPIYGFFIWVAMIEAPDPGYWLLVFPVVITAITWPRFPQEVIPGFLDGMKRVFQRFN
jgi:hypothetical protein